MPTGGTVLFSALVWGGRTTGTAEQHADPALADQVRLTVPAGTGTESHTRTASTFDVGADHGCRGYVEVTDLVAGAGSGKYTVADVQSSIGGADGYAGWSLVVVVADPYAPARNLTVMSGYGDVGAGGTGVTMDVDGFRAASNGTVSTTLGTVVFDGDAGQTGDQLWFDGTAVADALNPADNTFNSTISARGAKVGNREPAYVNQLGFDADQLAVDGVLANGATSATVSFTSTADTYHPALVALATDLDDPALVAATSVRDLNGGGGAPGDVLIYTVTVRNKGLGTAVGSTFFDAIPTGTTFVPGSILVDPGRSWSTGRPGPMRPTPGTRLSTSPAPPVEGTCWSTSAPAPRPRPGARSRCPRRPTTPSCSG